ncbi:SLC5 family protein [Parvularcula lutaonensis]|uniref:SLC5 family protein n=1 Tax=Parvularcula lutaonensis TaxID=491923 RepID=A0ABV7MAL0_9PROT|nr:SLC5 family protein [Parvularcula lutaonensis]
MALDPIQIGVFFGLTALIGLLTWWQCSGGRARGSAIEENSAHDYFLAGNGLPWFFVAGSITLTNLSTDQLVGMNGNQMLLLAWWELAAVAGLFILAFVFIPVYYRNNCTTTTELLERRYNNPHIRALISIIFMLGSALIFLPAALYGGSLFMKTMFNTDVPLMLIALFFAVVGAAYAILGGLRAVAVSDTFSGIGLLSLALVVVYLALKAVDFDIVTGVPVERLSMVGGPDSPIPWPTLLTGMILIQVYYWSTNQTITQRAMAAPSIREAQKGIMAAAAIRLLIVPVIVVVPGVVAFKLYGDINDAAFGTLVGDILPPYLSGAFAAMMAAAVLTTFNSLLNSVAALYVVDIHQRYINPDVNVPRVSTIFSLVMTVAALALVPVYQNAESLINLLQELYGLGSMPVLSAFALALLFNNVDYRAAMAGVVFGVGLYALYTFWLNDAGIITMHYIHFMAVTFFSTVAFALGVNRIVFGKSASLRLGESRVAPTPAE